MALGADAERLEHQHHLPAQVAQGVVRRRREVALLRAVLVAERGQPSPRRWKPWPRSSALLGVDLVERRVRLLVEDDVVEHVELGLGAEVGDVGHAARAQMLLGLDRHVARVARVGLARDRVEHHAHERDRRRLVERVEDRGRRVGHQQHVRLVDLLEPADRRAVEADPLAERVLVERRERHPHVLPGSRQVGELQVHQPRAVALGQVEHVAGTRITVSDQRTNAQRLGGLPVHDVGDRHPVSSCYLDRAHCADVARVYGRVAKNPAKWFALDRMEKGRTGIFDTGTKTRGLPPDHSPRWFPDEED